MLRHTVDIKCPALEAHDQELVGRVYFDVCDVAELLAVLLKDHGFWLGDVLALFLVRCDEQCLGVVTVSYDKLTVVVVSNYADWLCSVGCWVDYLESMRQLFR